LLLFTVSFSLQFFSVTLFCRPSAYGDTRLVMRSTAEEASQFLRSTAKRTRSLLGLLHTYLQSVSGVLVDYQSVSAERIACLLRRLQSRYKTFKLLKSEVDCQPVCRERLSYLNCVLSCVYFIIFILKLQYDVLLLSP